VTTERGTRVPRDTVVTTECDTRVPTTGGRIREATASCHQGAALHAAAIATQSLRRRIPGTWPRRAPADTPKPGGAAPFDRRPAGDGGRLVGRHRAAVDDKVTEELPTMWNLQPHWGLDA